MTTITPGLAFTWILITLITILVTASSFPWPAALPSPVKPQDFQLCVTRWVTTNYGGRINTSDFYSQNNPFFTAVLNSTANNLRCLDPSIAKPQLIFTPEDETQVQAAVACANRLKSNVRIRSGGHDYEGLSYISRTKEPFIILDLRKLRQVTIDVQENTAWVQAGATTGELYYKIHQASPTLAFPGGLHTSLGIGGHLTGGAYGSLMRLYGLGAHNVIDARMVDLGGRVLDKNSMGADVFWAISGGGGGSFGVIVAWKLQLVHVPENVTVFNFPKTLKDGATQTLYKWQKVAPEADRRLFVRVIIQAVHETTPTVVTVYNALFLGHKKDLLSLMNTTFPELRLTPSACKEMSWIESVLFIAGFKPRTKPEVLLQAKPTFLNFFKAKSDFVYRPIPTRGLTKLWKKLIQDPGQGLMIFNPFGGAIANASEESIPFPHGKSSFMIQYVANWKRDNKEIQTTNEEWVRGIYDYMEPFVSRFPRGAYVNYRDLDLGRDESCKSNCTCPYLWGEKYFKGNLYRLIKAKKQVDSRDFFHHEQSIPVSHSVVSQKKCYDLV